MLVPISWLNDLVEIDIPIEELARRLTLAGLEVEGIRYVGLPLLGRPSTGHGTHAEANVSGLAWDREKIVVGEIREVMPHPNADRLVLCRLFDGDQENTVLTGAPNLFPYKEKGELSDPLKVAYAKEGATIYDGHKPGAELMTLKRTKIRGVESYSMACSEKELGISDDHEGVILLDEDAIPGTSLADYMGDVILDIAILPNIARNANILGVAREVAALTGARLKEPEYQLDGDGDSIEGKVRIEILEPTINPRFVLGLIEGVEIGKSPYWVQRRLRLAGVRPINNIVDVSNYVMLEIGQPLHAFDYEVLVSRAEGKTPRIITRLPEKGESLVTLDGETRTPDDFTILVADEAGALSLGGVMGGFESEVSEKTTKVLLEGASWNYENIRRTVRAQNLPSEAAYRFERGVHPEMTWRGVTRGLQMMKKLAGGTVAAGIVDEYPTKLAERVVEIQASDTMRWLGITIEAGQMAEILRKLEFEVEVSGEVLSVRVPDHRLDIGEGTVGKADLMEEVARIYGYDQIPETQIADAVPPQYGNPRLDRLEHIRDLLSSLGLQEVITYRLTSPESEALLSPENSPKRDKSYMRISNPIAADRAVMQTTLMPGMLEVVQRNARIRDRIAIFELGPVFHPIEDEPLPAEPWRLAIVLSGPRAGAAWEGGDASPMTFYDLKGIIDRLFEGLHMPIASYQPAEHKSFHPGSCAGIRVEGDLLGWVGEIHPIVRERFDMPPNALFMTELDLEMILSHMPDRYPVRPVPIFPPVLEDLAIVVDEQTPSSKIHEVITDAASDLVREINVFDVYRGEQVGEGMKSLAFSLVYQAEDRTLTDEEVAEIRARIVKQLDQKLGAKLRA
jgi:phenylalanyl-tRNA synthetase beta chain